MKNATSHSVTPVVSTHVTTPVAAPAPTPAPEVPVTTLVDLLPIKAKHVAAHLGMKPTSLRRILRTMPAYADGCHTNYGWPDMTCAAIKEIENRVKNLQADKIARAAAAKAALEARIAATKATEAANAAAATATN